MGIATRQIAYPIYPANPASPARPLDQSQGLNNDPWSNDPEQDGGYEPPPSPRGRRAREPGFDHGATPAARPNDGARVAALPADADPAYSTPVDYDGEVDFSLSTARVVSDPTGQPAGSITIDTHARKLYLSLSDGRAIEYGVGVGRQGFSWKGQARIGRKAFWPGWTPPREMLGRRPDLPQHMDGGLNNPLGARALYLFTGARDTLFRIHGTNEPETIGRAVSSGCIRMLNADVIDLYRRVAKGARVVVL
ncbi:L,D-transpeptidase [Methylocystis sp.]|uniref:L,D-transpeptidase n=1 Tax=Methylocystis sp. TaxID=1911079 RepID=UPI0025CDAF6C|nr:L,D-transpeptidase [Methylocystis sp.]